MHKSSCLISIKNRYTHLTNVEKKIADYILKNAENVVTMSVSDLAENADVAKSAIIRCCKSLGYKGYAQLKLSLAGELSKNRQLNYVPYIAPHDDASNILDKVFAANVKTLHDTAEKIDRRVLQNVVNLLADSRIIYIYGIGTSSAIVNDFQYRLTQAGFTALCFTDAPSMKISTMNIKKGDAAIGISNSGRTIATIDALHLARENGAETVCITSYSESPITKECTYPIEIYTDEIAYPVEAVSARIAHISVIDAITIALSAKNYENAVKRSKISRELIDTIRY